MHITKFACEGHRCKVVQYAPHEFGILYVEGYGSTTYRTYWTVRQVRLAVSVVVYKEALRKASEAVKPKSCPECGRGTFDGRDCFECGYFTH